MGLGQFAHRKPRLIAGAFLVYLETVIPGQIEADGLETAGYFYLATPTLTANSLIAQIASI